MFGKILVHEFLISYSHTEWYLLFSRVFSRGRSFGRSFAHQNIIKLMTSITLLRYSYRHSLLPFFFRMLYETHSPFYAFSFESSTSVSSFANNSWFISILPPFARSSSIDLPSTLAFTFRITPSAAQVERHKEFPLND